MSCWGTKIVVFLFVSNERWSWNISRSKFYPILVASTRRKGPMYFVSTFRAACTCKLSYVNLFPTPSQKCKFSTIAIVALCGWAAKADDSFVCFGAKPDKGFLDLKSRRIRKLEGDAKESWRRDPDESSWRWTAERRVEESWRGTTDRGSQPRTRETVAEKIGSSDSESRWVWFQ